MTGSVRAQGAGIALPAAVVAVVQTPPGGRRREFRFNQARGYRELERTYNAELALHR